MKKAILTSFVFVLFFVFQSSAANDELFSYDKAKFETQLSQVNQLENYVVSNEDVTYSKLLSSDNSLITNVSPNPVLPGSAYNTDSKAMGLFTICCMGTIAGLVIYLMYIYIQAAMA
jgi:uncharacterized membrane-anchored protein